MGKESQEVKEVKAAADEEEETALEKTLLWIQIDEEKNRQQVENVEKNKKNTS